MFQLQNQTSLRSLAIILSLSLFGAGAMAIPEQGQSLMVTSASREASAAGVEIGKRGGNAVDVAVATALALAVTRPYYAAFGGGGFALVRMGRQMETLDFRETAPQATSEDYYSGKMKRSSLDGGAAVGVPGTSMGLWELHKKYGKLHWSELFQPAIRLATEGFVVSNEWSRITKGNQDRFSEGGKKILFKKGGQPYLPGDNLKQPEFGRLLKEMRNRGVVPIYGGMAGQDIVSAVKSTGGDLTLEDLKNYKVRWLGEPLKTNFRGYEIYLMPPPSSGGIVISSALKMIEKVKLWEKAPMSIDELHTLAEIMARAFRGRALLGDPDFHKNPVNQLTSDKYIDEMVNSISPKKVVHLDPLAEGHFNEGTHTTHLSVMSQNGDAVAMTITLNDNYGSGVVSPKFGIALNNEMDDFTTKPGEPNLFGLVQGKANAVQPGKRPLSSMSPTIVVKEGKTVMTLGSPGGPRIINGVLQVLYRTLVSGWDVDRAIQAPRIHNQFLPRKLSVDSFGFAPETLEGLKAKGHEVTVDWSVGRVYAIKFNADGLLEGAFDSRGDGGALGY